MSHNESLLDRPMRLCLRVGWDMLIHRGTFLFKYMLRVNATVSNKKSMDIVNYCKRVRLYCAETYANRVTYYTLFPVATSEENT